VELGEQGVGNARAPAGPAAERSPGAAPADTPAEDGSPGPPPSDSANPGDDPAPQDPARADAGEEPSDPDANRDQADADRRETPDAPGGGEEEEAGTGSARVVLQPQPPTATQGGVIQLWVSIRGGVDVRGVPFHLWYDPQRVAFQGAREGAFLAPAGNTTFMTSADDVTGRVMVGYSVLGAGQGVSGQGTLCVLTFRALAPGTASFSFSNASVRSASRGVQPASFQPAIVEIR
jgi:general secretion pathway protein D